MTRVDLDKIANAMNKSYVEKKKPSTPWIVEESKKIEMIHGRDPVIVERTLKPGEEGIRNIKICRGNTRVNFDIKSAHIIALFIKELSYEYVPEALTEESIRKDNEVDNAGESV